MTDCRRVDSLLKRQTQLNQYSNETSSEIENVRTETLDGEPEHV